MKITRENSFGQHLINIYGEDAIEKYWCEENIYNPFEISRSCGKKVWLKCEKHDKYDTLCNRFYNGSRCCYCSHAGRVHPKESFAQWGIDNVGEDFLEKYWDYDLNKLNPWKIAKSSSKKRVYLKCQENVNHGSYETIPNTFVDGHRCGYCNGQQVCESNSLGTIFPDSLLCWSDKNNRTPYEYSSKSNRSVWWKCQSGEHEDYPRSIWRTVDSNFRCPKCVKERTESIVEEKVRKYISELGYDMNHEWNCTIIPRNPRTNRQLPYDNEIIKLKLIIEVHGCQHYRLNGLNIKNRPELTLEQGLHLRKLLDRYKSYYAYKCGYEYLEIPHWTADGDCERYKRIIDNKISEIISKERVE